MSAVTADNTEFMRTKQLRPDGMIIEIPVASSTIIFKDTFVGLNAAGFLVSYVPWAQALTPTGTPLAGIAIEHITSQTSDGDAVCKVQVEGYFAYALTAGAQLDVGKTVCALDNATLTKVQANNEPVGRIVGIESSAVIIVELASPTVRSGWLGGMKTVVREIDYGGVVSDEVYLIHETENHNGIVLVSIQGIVTEQHEATTAQGIVTIVHTLGTDTTMGATSLAIDSGPINDLSMFTGGQMIAGATTASANDLVPAPADKAVIAKLTTVSDDGSLAGKEKLVARFVAL